MFCSIFMKTITEKDLSRYLSNKRDLFNRDGEVYGYEGKLENLTIQHKNRNLKIEGSLATFYFGHNFNTLTYEQSREALQRISDKLHYDLSEADVTRIDFAQNFEMKEHPLNYFPCLIEAANLNRIPQKNTLYLQNRQRCLAFYNKIKEYNDKLKVIPEYFCNKNILRYERRLYHPKVKVKNLYKPEYFNSLLSLWKKDYDKILKVPFITTSKEIGMFNKKAFEREATKLLINTKFGGIQNYFQYLDNEQRKGNIKKQDKSNYKKYAVKSCQQPDLITENDLVSEMNEKVNDTYENFFVLLREQ